MAEHPAPAPAQSGGLGEPRLRALLEQGALHFNAGRFFESHEAWEEAWHGAPDGERDFFQGLIHAAAACLHHERGNGHGYGRQVERMVRRLGPFGQRHRGVDVAALTRAVLALPPPPRRATGYPRLSVGRSGKR